MIPETLSVAETVGAALLALVISGQLWAAVAVIRKREPISIIDTMNATIAEMAVRIREGEARQEASHRQILKLESLATELDRGLKILLAQLARSDTPPDYTQIGPPLADVVSVAASAALAARDNAKLQRKIVRTFSMDELENLAFQLDIDDGELGEKTKSGRARAIILYMERNKRTDELMETLGELRQNEDW